MAVAHGHRDRITSFRASAAFARRAEDVASAVEFQDMGPVGHYMFRRAEQWNDFALTRSLQYRKELLDLPLPPETGSHLASMAAESLEEQRHIEAADTMPFEIYRQQYLSPDRLRARRVNEAKA